MIDYKDNQYIVNTSEDVDIIYLNNNVHKIGGPAITIPNGYEAWWINNRRHRADGPAIKHANGDEDYYINYIYFSKEEYKLTSILFRVNMIYEL